MPSVESAQRSGQRTPFGAAEKVANWQRNVYYIYGGTISAVQWARGVGRPVREVTCETTTKMANLDGRLWPMALQYSMWSQMQKQLYPNKEVIPFGTRVHVKRKVYGVGNKYDLESRWDIGYYLGPSRDVNEGSVVMMKKGNFITTTYMRPGLVNADKEVELEDYHAVVATPSNRLRRKSTTAWGSRRTSSTTTSQRRWGRRRWNRV